jgi:hypothetical protein
MESYSCPQGRQQPKLFAPIQEYKGILETEENVVFMDGYQKRTSSGEKVTQTPSTVSIYSEMYLQK